MPNDIHDGYYLVEDADGERLVKKDPIDPYLRVSADWKPEPKYVCRECGDAARMHPDTNSIWGCLKCGMTTAAVFYYFRRADDAE